MVVRPCREGPARGSEALLCVWSEKLGRESVSKSVGNGDFKAPSIVWISPDDRGLGSYIPAHHGCVSVFSTVSSVSTTSSASCRADLSVLSHSAIAPFLLFAVHYLIRGLVLNLSLQTVEDTIMNKAAPAVKNYVYENHTSHVIFVLSGWNGDDSDLFCTVCGIDNTQTWHSLSSLTSDKNSWT